MMKGLEFLTVGEVFARLSPHSFAVREKLNFFERQGAREKLGEAVSAILRDQFSPCGVATRKRQLCMSGPSPVRKTMENTPVKMHAPKRSLGQNFLRDANIARKIVRALNVEEGDRVLEIGPGQGALTGLLKESVAAALVLVEKDDHWAAERAAGEEGAFFPSAEAYLRHGRDRAYSVVADDALRLPWERFTGTWKCIGNLPYNIASPLLWELCSRFSTLRRAVFMIQKEVGLRVVAVPGTSAYGALSVWVQSFMRPRLEFVVPPQVFHPRPKVDSSVLSFVPLPEPPSVDTALLAATLHGCFQMRRKQLGTIARSCGASAADVEKAGVDPMLRPEALPPADFHALAETGIFVKRD